jgi:D-serine deaminase-like pyridoxal phosphate-dependent protein
VSLAGDVPAESAPSAAAPPTGGSPDRLTTPAVLVDRGRLQRNIDRMAARVAGAGAQLWPHVKTHKSPAIARLQLQAGAVGMTAATLTEAELLVDDGFGEVILAHPPVGRWRRERIVALAGRCRLLVACDDGAALLELDEACRAAGVEARYLWEVDCGLHRCGTPPGAPTAEAVAAVAPRLRSLAFAGLMTFPGHVYGAADDRELDAIARQELEAIRGTAAALAERGIECPVLSIGSTPTIHRMPGEIAGMVARPGNYVFYDATQVSLGIVDADDCALTVLATVISRVAADRFVLDAGSKALSGDRMTERSPGYGTIIGHPEATIAKLFEEHAIVHGPAGGLTVGDRVRIIPNHACAVANLHPELHIVDDGQIVDRWPVGARGWTQRP